MASVSGFYVELVERLEWAFMKNYTLILALVLKKICWGAAHFNFLFDWDIGPCKAKLQTYFHKTYLEKKCG